MLEDTIISLLAKSPADQYSLYRQIGGTTRMSQILKAISVLQRSRVIHVAKYRKSVRTGLEVPIYSLSKGGKTSNGKSNNNRRSTNSNIKRLDVHDLLAGVTSERLVEYEFVARNLMSSQKQATILDIGSGSSMLAEAISKFGKGKWAVFRIDIAKSNCDIMMDARMTGFRKAVFDQVICISTIEHIGIGTDYTGYYDDDGDIKTIKEIVRILKKGGNALITIPYGKITKPAHRVYDRHALSRLLDVDTGSLVKATKEFYCYKVGKWKRCSQGTADRMIAADVQAPLHFHSMTCACILLRKR
jgi:ubiquinone/menaquinone biosynthesis C-methylase UbiE